jgi:Zn-dependent peptidase ImmA (M78 family)
MPIRRKKILDSVVSLLKKHGVTAPPVPVEKIARDEGATIYAKPLESEMAGYFYRDKGNVVIGVNSSQSPVRQRFTVGHELGHFLLHEYHDPHWDRDTFRVRLRGPESSEGTDVAEMEANLFAAELLMPTSFLKRDLKLGTSVDLLDDEIVAKLAKRYGVSTQALLIKLSRMNYMVD